jgi:hypothetical protein
MRSTDSVEPSHQIASVVWRIEAVSDKTSAGQIMQIKAN